MSWILSTSGQEISLLQPQPGRMLLADIAHALAQINRFNGHARRPYSVAEHSLLVAEICERLMPVTVGGRFAALMHDAHEAYCGDLATPTKRLLGEHWAHLEGRLERAVRSAFALHTHTHEAASAIKQADLIALATERAQLLPPGSSWEALVHVQPAEWVDLMDPARCQMTWQEWRQAFIDKADELDFARIEEAGHR